MGGVGVTGKVILATLILFAPLMLMFIVTAVVEASDRWAHRFDRFDAQVLGRIDRMVQR